MAVKVYTGARYVPIFADPVEWDKAKTYEALTIVSYQGDSYTSRQIVPSNIEISNTDYWVKTGNFNAQVESVKTQINALSNQITGFDSRIESNKTDITSLDGRMEMSEQRISAVESDVSDDAQNIQKNADNITEVNARVNDVETQTNNVSNEVNNVKNVISENMPVYETPILIEEGYDRASDSYYHMVGFDPSRFNLKAVWEGFDNWSEATEASDWVKNKSALNQRFVFGCNLPLGGAIASGNNSADRAYNTTISTFGFLIINNDWSFNYLNDSPHNNPTVSSIRAAYPNAMLILPIWEPILQASSTAPTAPFVNMKTSDADNYNYIIQRKHSRTLIGRRTDGNIWFVFIEGRTTRSKGMNHEQLVSFGRSFNFTDLYNGDGGGSSQCWINVYGSPMNIVFNDDSSEASGFTSRELGSFMYVEHKEI